MAGARLDSDRRCPACMGDAVCGVVKGGRLLPDDEAFCSECGWEGRVRDVVKAGANTPAAT